MSEIIRDGPDSFEAELTCHICHTVFVVTTDDLYRGEFKEDPHTYWFDGSARAVKKYKEPFVEIFDQPEPAPMWPNPPSKNSINTNV